MVTLCALDCPLLSMSWWVVLVNLAIDGGVRFHHHGTRSWLIKGYLTAF